MSTPYGGIPGFNAELGRHPLGGTTRGNRQARLGTEAGEGIEMKLRIGDVVLIEVRITGDKDEEDEYRAVFSGSSNHVYITENDVKEIVSRMEVPEPPVGALVRVGHVIYEHVLDTEWMSLISGVRARWSDLFRYADADGKKIVLLEQGEVLFNAS